MRKAIGKNRDGRYKRTVKDVKEDVQEAREAGEQDRVQEAAETKEIEMQAAPNQD